MKNLEKEIKLLSEYMKIYIQFLPTGAKCNKSQIPTFEEFKENIQIFRSPKFKERKYFIENRLVADTARGLGTDDENIFYRKYCIFRGVKFYPANNFKRLWSINDLKLQSILSYNAF